MTAAAASSASGGRRAPVEQTVQYATSVASLPEAWTFVMERLNLVGADPHIEIRPVWSADYGTASSEGSWTRHFEVSVSGTVEVRG